MSHEQKKLPSVLVHIWSHPPLSVKHSLMSANYNNILLDIIYYNVAILTSFRLSEIQYFKQHPKKILPVQSNPLLSRLNPVLQEQEKLPSMLVHVCSHPPLSVKHSLMSGENN